MVRILVELAQGQPSIQQKDIAPGLGVILPPGYLAIHRKEARRALACLKAAVFEG